LHSLHSIDDKYQLQKLSYVEVNVSEVQAAGEKQVFGTTYTATFDAYVRKGASI
jgi:hypothetical protein